MYNIEIKCTPVLEDRPTTVRRANDALDIILPLFPKEDSWREQCHALFLDRKNQVIGQFLVGVGGTTNVPFDLKAVCVAALGVLASGVILVHNHPSGDPHPGVQDRDITEKLKKALTLLDMQLIDHIIIGEKTFFSFAEEVASKLPDAA